jgi:hypothetical protein
MSIVLWGMGAGEIDSETSVVTFGLNRDLEPGQTIEQAAVGASIENLFVIDYGQGRRRATAAEYRRYKRMLKMVMLGNIRWEQKKGRGAKPGDIEYWATRKPHMKKAA